MEVSNVYSVISLSLEVCRITSLKLSTAQRVGYIMGTKCNKTSNS